MLCFLFSLSIFVCKDLLDWIVLNEWMIYLFFAFWVDASLYFITTNKVASLQLIILKCVQIFQQLKKKNPC